MEDLSKPSITVQEIKARVERVKACLRDRGLDAILAFSSYQEKEGNVCYLTGYHNAFPPSANTDSIIGLGYTAVLLDHSHDPILFSMSKPPSIDGLFISEVVDGLNLVSSIASKLLELGHRRSKIGIAGLDVLPHAIYKAITSRLHEVEFVDADSLLLELRMVKSEAEIEVLRAGARIADEGFDEAVEVSKEGMSERDLAALVIRRCLEAGADWVARTRVYSGGSTTSSWPLVSNRKFKRGELVGLDLVGWYGNYAFDLQRFWTVGRPSSEIRELLEVAAELTDYAVRHASAGSKASYVCEAVNQMASELGIASYAKPWGHAIGIEVVERPYLLRESDEVLREGMTLCVEPVITHPKLGKISFEDEIALTPGRQERLNTFPKLLY